MTEAVEETIIRGAIAAYRSGGKPSFINMPEALADLMRERVANSIDRLDQWVTCTDRDAFRAIDKEGNTLAIVTGPEIFDACNGLPLGTTQPAREVP